MLAKHTYKDIVEAKKRLKIQDFKAPKQKFIHPFTAIMCSNLQKI